MKIAICLYGNVGISKDASARSNSNVIEESRIANTDPTICYNSIKKLFLDKYDTDIFIHSWSKNYEHVLNKLYEPKSSLFEDQIVFDVHLEDYGINKDEKIETWNVSDIAKQSYNLLLESRENEEKLIKELELLSFRSQSRWYSTKKSVDLMKEFSDISNIKYDFVLLTRIDCLFKKEIDFSNLNNNMFYTSFRKGRKDEGIALYDFFFLSSQKFIEDFSSLYSDVYQYSIRPPFSSMEHALNKFSENNICHLLDYREDYDKVRMNEKQNRFIFSLRSFFKKIRAYWLQHK